MHGQTLKLAGGWSFKISRKSTY